MEKFFEDFFMLLRGSARDGADAGFFLMLHDLVRIAPVLVILFVLLWFVLAAVNNSWSNDNKD